MTKDPRVYLAHILECVERITQYTSTGKAAFLADKKTQDAVVRNFEVIGEAAKRVPEGFRRAYPSVPWRSLAGFRDVLIHQYEGVSLPRVWSIVEKDLRGLQQAIAAILPPLDQLERELAGEDDS